MEVLEIANHFSSYTHSLDIHAVLYSKEGRNLKYKVYIGN